MFYLFMYWLRDPSSPTRDWTQASCIERSESQPLDHKGSSCETLVTVPNISFWILVIGPVITIWFSDHIFPCLENTKSSLFKIYTSTLRATNGISWFYLVFSDISLGSAVAWISLGLFTWDSLSFLNMRVYVFHQIWGISSHYLFK